MKRVAFILAGALLLATSGAFAQEVERPVVRPLSEAPVVEGRASSSAAAPGSPTMSAYRRRFVVAGGVSLGASYLLSFAGALAMDSSPRQAATFVPVVGPFIALVALEGERCPMSGGLRPLEGLGESLACGAGHGLLFVTLLADGVVQFTGFVMLLYGLIHDDPPGGSQSVERERWTLSPGAPGSPLGLTLTGQYF